MFGVAHSFGSCVLPCRVPRQSHVCRAAILHNNARTEWFFVRSTSRAVELVDPISSIALCPEFRLPHSTARDPECLPTMDLSPLYVDRVLRLIRTVNKEGVSIFMVEQNASLALEIAHEACVLQTGCIVLSGSARELKDDPRVRDAYLRGADAA
jgi:hypothetical protein